MQKSSCRNRPFVMSWWALGENKLSRYFFILILIVVRINSYKFPQFYLFLCSSTTCNHEPWPCRINHHQQPVIPARIFAPKSVLASAEDEFGGCIPGYLNAAFKILGPHPFSRLDIVVLPRCFASIGLAR